MTGKLSLVCAIFVVALCFFQADAATKQSTCSIADIIFIMDESSSIWPQPFDQQKKFIKDVINMFQIGVNETRVGMIRFSTQGRIAFYMNQYHDNKTLGAAIDRVQQRGGNTNTGDALRLAREYGFVKKNGGRPGDPLIPQIAIVITDGNSQEGDKTAAQADLTHKAGITVFAIGVGGSISHQELKNIASDHEYIFTVKNYDALDKIKEQLGKKACEITIPEPTMPPMNILDDCKEKKMDLTLVLDKSSDLDDAKFYQMKGLLQSLLYSFDVSEEYTRVAIVSYASSGQIELPLSKLNDRKSIHDIIRNIKKAPGKNYLAGAFKTIRSIYNPKYGARTKVSKVVLLLTNTAIVDTDVAIAESQNLQQTHGVEIFAVGVDKANAVALKAVVGPDHVIMATSYSQLMSAAIRNDVAENICPILPPPEDFGCGERNGADIAFALDTVNAGNSDISSMHSFISQVTSKFEIGPEKIQVSFTPNQCQAADGFNFNTHSTKPQVIDALNYEFKSQTVNIIDKLNTETFSSAKGARSTDSGTKRFAVLFVDGAPGSMADAKKAADKAKNDGNMEIFIIGIGPKVSAKDLVQIASSPNHVILVKSYEELESNASLAGSLSDTICKKLQ